MRGHVALVSLGCAKNLVDSEGLVGRLQAAGFELVSTVDEADLVLINTCGFIDPAKEESIDAIVEVAQHRESGRMKGLIVAGCLVERYLDDLARDLPEVDCWLPFRDYPRIVEAAESLMGLPRIPPPPPEHVLLTPSPYAYLKISEGCDRKCAFCAIPAIRGRLRSRTIEDNVADARRIAESGVSEVNIVSQDTTAYGRDLYGRPHLVDLLRELTKIPGPTWWRTLYLYPSILHDDVLDVIASNERIVKYVDIPLQHMSSKVLRRMRRGVDAKHQFVLLERIRSRVPDVAVRTTLITGFPGETNEDHAENLACVRDGLFDRLGVFPFSREEGTASYDLPHQVPAARAEERRGELMEAQQTVHFASNRARVGRTVDVLVETVDPREDTAVGRTAWDAPEVDAWIHLLGAGGLEAGRVVPVRVTGVRDYDLEGCPAP